jgi:DNA-binding NtrC family response regulator
MCWILIWFLQRQGYSTIAVENGRDAIEIARNSPLSLAFIDAKLPDIEGHNLAQQLQTLQSDLPVILVSGYFYDDDQSVQNWMQQGIIRAFIGKPFLFDQIRNALQHILAIASPNAYTR